MSSDRELLLGLTDRRYRDVTVDMPDGSTHTFCIQSLTVAERAKYLDSMWDKKTNKPAPLAEMQVRLVATTLVNADTKQPVFSQTDRTQLLNVDGSVIGQLHDAAADFCGIGKRRVEAEMGNSPETPDEDG